MKAIQIVKKERQMLIIKTKIYNQDRALKMKVWILFLALTLRVK